MAPTTIRRLLAYLMVGYFCQGLAQTGSGVIAQPLVFYLKARGLSPAQIADLLALAALPWLIKPLYGIIADVAGQRRTLVIVVSGLALAGFGALSLVASPLAITVALSVCAAGIAFGDVLNDAIAVDEGRRVGRIEAFQARTWFFFSAAAGLAGLIGGALCARLTPLGALRAASLLAGAAPLALLLCALLLLRRDPPASFHRAAARQALAGLASVLRSRSLLRVAAFLFFVGFSPSLGTPLFFWYTDRLHLEQSEIGQIHAVGSAAALAGALAFGWLSGRLPPRTLLWLGLVLAGAVTLGHLLLQSRTSALVLSGLSGAAGMIAFLGLLGAAGRAAPPGATAFTFAALMSVLNLSGQLSGVLGARLFEAWDQQLAPLVVVSAATTLAALVFVPFLPPGRGNEEH